MRKLVAAIDLGTSKVVCLVGEKTDAGIKIIALNEAPAKGVSRGEVVNIQSALDSMLPTIQNVENAIGEKINDVFIGVAGQNIRCIQGTNQTTRIIPDELITLSEIEEITKKMHNTPCQEGEEVLHAIPQLYNVDDFMGITESELGGMTGKEIISNFKLVIGKKTSTQQRNNVLKRSGLNLKGIFLEPLASAKAVLEEEEKEVGVVLLDIGGGTTDLVIIHENVIKHTAVIPFGGNCITEDLKQGCGVSTIVAEQLKTIHGSCMSSVAPDRSVRINGIGGREDKEISFKMIAEIIESRVEEILEAAMHEIERSGLMEKINAGLVITGGTSQLANLKPFARLVTGLDTRLANPSKLYALMETPLNRPSLSTGVGLVVMGFEEMEKQEKQGKSYSSTSPINYGMGRIKPAQDKVMDETKEKEKEKVTEKTEEKPKGPKKSWWERFTADNVFKDNDNEA